MSMAEVRTWCENLLKLTEEDWCRYALEKEPLREKVKDCYFPYYCDAVCCGKQQAALMQRDNAGKNVWELTKKLGVKLSVKEFGSAGSAVMFACYYEPDRIELYSDNAARTQMLIKELALEDLLGDFSVEEMLLAHELYHVLAYQKPELYTSQKHITLWKLGRFCYRARLASLEEAAAMSFAKELMQLKISPYIMDVLMLYPHSPELAEKLYQKLMRILQENKEV